MDFSVIGLPMGRFLYDAAHRAVGLDLKCIFFAV
jgi:hypothetical protein